MKFNFRKITSALASTAILGSTVALAAAANFPAPFVKNGVADVAIVYGASDDLAAVTDISSALSAALASGESSSSAAGASEDAYPLFTSSTPLQLNTSLNSVRTSLTDNNLPSVLGDTDFSGVVDAEASFQILLGSNARLVYAKEPTTSDDPMVGVLFGTSAGGSPGYLYNATVTFDEAVALNDTESEGETLSLFGADYTIASATGTSKLVLFKEAQSIFLSAGSETSTPSQEVVVDDETYTIDLVTASDTSATVRVTNSVGTTDQKEINEGASKKIIGVEVAIVTSDESTATNIIQAEILVGANRITLEDGEEVKVGTDEDTIDGTLVDFVTGDLGTMQKFTVQVFAPEGSEDFLVEGGELVDPVFGSFRLVFDGLAVSTDSEDDREVIEIKPSGNDKASVTFTSWQGETLSSWDWLNNETGGRPGSFLGDSDEWSLNVLENGAINESGYSVVGNEDEGVLVELSTLTNGTTGYSDDVVEFTNVITNDKYSASLTSEGVGTVNIEGRSYTVTYWDNKQGDNSQNVRLDWAESGTAGHVIAYPTIETSKGAKIAFYEPILIDFGNINAVGQDLVTLKFPDGDGYTDVALSNTANQLFTINGVAGFNSSLGNGTIVTIGKLSYAINVSAASLGAANMTSIKLMEGGNVVNNPAIVLFEEEDESDVYHTVIVETSGAGVSDAGVSISEASFSWNGDADMKNSAYNNGIELESDDDMYVKMDQFGTMVTMDQSDSDQYSLMISYPDEQAVANIYVDALVDGSSGSSGALGNVKLMDSELAASEMKDNNLIIVGGSCVNTAAASLVGASDTGCGPQWTSATGASSGQWIIQTFANSWAESTGKVATLVAGWEQGDTKDAATYLTTQNVNTAVGQKLTGSQQTTVTTA